MTRGIGVGLVSSLVALLAVPASTSAQTARSQPGAQIQQGPEHPAASYYRRGQPQVKGFVARRGGYSYSPSDSINTYGNSRTLYGGANSYRDPMLDRQTTSGPFDHGFFFDSGIGPRGGNSPYPN